MNKTLAIAFFAAVLGIGLYGCSKKEEPAPLPKATSGPPVTENSAVPVSFKNDKGELVCPVTGETIASEKAAQSFQDFDGKRYYFCCGMCPPEFKKDPAKYADGKAIKAGTTMKM